MKKLFVLFAAIAGITFPLLAQNVDSMQIQNFFNKALWSETSYNNLKQLCEIAPGRLAGTSAMDSAMQFTYRLMKAMPFDSVYIQHCNVRQWFPGADKAWYTTDGDKKTSITVDILGGSIPTPLEGIYANVIAFSSIEDMQKADPSTIKGKIVYFNRPMNQTYYNAFRAYSENAQIRVFGADEASKLGAVAVLVRSLNTVIDTFPHTGIMRYKTTDIKIPGFSICTQHASDLTEALIKDPNTKVFLKSTCVELPEIQQGNVIGEIKGSSLPNHYITVGGHLDSWYNSAGAHDDGGGCIQSLEVARLFFETGYKPQNTLRVVMFIDEEMDQRGGKKYAEEAVAKNEKHVFALESDRGVALPIGFSIDASDIVFNKIVSMKELLEPYGFYLWYKGGSGVDVGFLKGNCTSLAGIVCDSQRYFEYHHSANDTFDKIVRREMQLGAAGMASLIYLIDKYGLE